jgi:hypothetical protein
VSVELSKGKEHVNFRFKSTSPTSYKAKTVEDVEDRMEREGVENPSVGHRGDTDTYYVLADHIPDDLKRITLSEKRGGGPFAESRILMRERS